MEKLFHTQTSMSVRKIPRSGIAGSKDTHVLNLDSDHHIVIQKCYINLYLMLPTHCGTFDG